MEDQSTRAVLSAADKNDLPDSAFAYIEPGGSKDADGKTTPRKLRHFPIHDKAHVANALSRAPQSPFGDKALPNIKAAAKKFGIDTQSNGAETGGEDRDDPTYADFGISGGLKAVKQHLAGVKADQLADPDNGTDPDDEDVMAAINDAEDGIDRAIVAQGKDSAPDGRSEFDYPVLAVRTSLSNHATAKRAFSSLVEQPPAHTGEFEVRMGSDNGTTARFVGYASTTGVPYSVRDWLGEYNETILPGAFAKTLREQGNVPLLFNHDGIPIASTGSGTSRLSEDKVGLRNEADLDRRDAVTNSLCIQLQRGVLDKMSFSFRAIKDTWNETYDDRGVNEAALYDSSIVTYPANPTTTAELQDSMRSALGREGRSLWVADGEMSIRSALPGLSERGELDTDAEDLLEKALRALVAADEAVCRSHGPHGRARTFHVASAMLELRAGKMLSAKNHALLQTAADALATADKHHAKAAKQHANASEALNSVLTAGQDGAGNNTPPGNENPILPQDGAGPRSARSLRLKREREAELRALRQS